ncbi:macrophage mannose receptor 1-like isoform X1, partial [Huso huso]
LKVLHLLFFFFFLALCAVASGHFRKYHFVEDRKSWFDAQSYCRENHTDLATIESQEEADNLSKTRDNGKNEAWIGLYRDVKKNWQWSNSDAVIINNLEAAHDIIKKSDITKESCVKLFSSTVSFSECSNASERYILIEESKTWYEAQQYCRENHTDLVSIKCDTEKEKIKNITKDGDKAFWIGLFNNPWKWSDGGDLDFQNWNSGKLSGDENEKCNDSDTAYLICCLLPFSETRESYILIDQPKTWYEAQQYCRTNYTDLVSIKNNDADKKIKKKANGKTVWIGLFNNPWKWSHKGEYSSFRNWDKGEPNSVGNNICVEMYGKRDKERGKWNDAGCHFASPFFCYNESCTDASCTKYHFVATAMNWSSAQTYCRDKYTDLATVHSQEEAKQLLGILNMDTNAWIGMYHDVSENWQWSNGDEVTYNTRRVKLFCATVSQDRDWTDSVCHDTKHFMCYNSSKGIFFSVMLSVMRCIDPKLVKQASRDV